MCDVQKIFSSETLNTYAPVVAWSALRIMLIFSFILRINIHSIYFSCSFEKSDIPKGEVFNIELPENLTCGREKYMSLNLDKSIYGKSEMPQL